MSAWAGGVAWGRAIGWGLYLACSWTWCIGMWLPVYLASDFGWPGWVAFLVPNVIGAAAMGLVLTRESSAAMVHEHAGAMRAFSVATILFHVGWLAALFSFLAQRSPLGEGWWGGSAAAATVAAGWLLSHYRGRTWAIPAAVVFAASIAVWIAAGLTGDTLRTPPDEGSQPVTGLAYGLPALVMGFCLCPYLDFTFHRARQESPGATGDAAFVLGFGIAFAALMVFSLLYAGGMLQGRWSLYLPIHFAAQSAFTIGVHLRELRRAGLGERRERGARSGALLLGLVVLMFGAVALPGAPDYREGISAARLGYFIMLSPYALIFPAYVYVVAFQGGAGLRARFRGWIAACVLAAPFLWMGFIEQRYEWIAVAVGIPLVAPIVVKLLAKRSGWFDPGPAP